MTYELWGRNRVHKRDGSFCVLYFGRVTSIYVINPTLLILFMKTIVKHITIIGEKYI